MSKKCSDVQLRSAVCAAGSCILKIAHSALQIKISSKKPDLNPAVTLMAPPLVSIGTGESNRRRGSISQIIVSPPACHQPRPPARTHTRILNIKSQRQSVVFQLAQLLSEFFAPNPFVCVKLRTRDRIGTAALVE